MVELSDLLKELNAKDPEFLKKLEEAAQAGLKKDKIATYNLFVKENKTFEYKVLDDILARHTNNRLDINWNREDFIYRIVVSKRKRAPEKPIKIVRKGKNKDAATTTGTEEQTITTTNGDTESNNK